MQPHFSVGRILSDQLPSSAVVAFLSVVNPKPRAARLVACLRSTRPRSSHFLSNVQVQFAIPSWVLLALPPSTNGSLDLGNLTNPTSFTASGLDFGFGYGTSASSASPNYQ